MRSCARFSSVTTKGFLRPECSRPSASQSRRNFSANLKKAQVKGATDSPLLAQTLGQALQAVEYPFVDAFVCPPEEMRLSFKNLKTQVNAVASGLVEKGFRRGDRLALWLKNESEAVIVPLGAAKIGVAVVFIKPNSTIEQVAKVLDFVQPRSLLFQEYITSEYDVFDALYRLIPEMKDLPLGMSWTSDRFPFLKSIQYTGDDDGKVLYHSNLGVHRFLENLLYDDAPAEHYSKKVQPTDPCVIQMDPTLSSACTFSHQALLAAAHNNSARLGLGEMDSLFLPSAATTASTWALGPLSSLVANIKIANACSNYSAEAVSKTMVDEGSTVVTGDAGAVGTLVNDKPASLGQVRAASFVFRENTASQLSTTNSLGVGSVSASFDGDLSLPCFQSAPGKAPSFGTIAPHAEAKVVNSHGEVCDPGQAGVLMTRGPLTGQEYLGGEFKETKSGDNWVKIADKAVIDAAGVLTV